MATSGDLGIDGLHVILLSPEAMAVRAFLADVLGLPSVDAGGGWPIFEAPPAELAVHPAESPGRGVYLMTRDLDTCLTALEARGVPVGPVTEQSWGRLASIRLEDGSDLPIYEPRHPRPGHARPTGSEPSE